MQKESKNYSIEKSKDGYNVAKINKNNKTVYIGSKYNVKDEIDRFFKNIDIKNKEVQFIVFGFGAGEHIFELRKRYNKNRIMIVEPNKGIKQYAESLEWVNEDKNICIVYCEKDREIEGFDGEFFNEYNLQDIKIIPFANYKNIYMEEYLFFCKKIRETYIHHTIERNTKIYFNRRWFETLLNNIPYMVDSPLIDFYKNNYKGKPAVIVSSGPSLDKNISELKRVQEEFFIISAGRSLVALRNEEIHANLFVSIDSHNLSYEFVQEFIKELDTPLLFTENTNEEILNNHRGFKICSTYSQAMYNIFSEYYKVNVLTSYGSVAHTMISAAVLLGCNPIILVGQDCAYTDNKAHSPFLEKNQSGLKFEEARRDSDFYVEDINGNKVRTSWELNGFRIGIEKIIKDNPDIMFINATEGGARIEGTIEMKLCEAIEKYGGNKVESLIEKSPDKHIKSRTINVISDMNRGLLYIKKKSNQALNLLGRLEIKSANYNKEIDYVIEKLDKIDKDINKKIKNFMLIETLLYPAMYEILVNRSINNELNEYKKKKLIIEENIKLYTAINKIIGIALKDINKTLDKLKE